MSRAAAVQMSTYLKEVGFYRDLQAHVDVRTPQVMAERHADQVRAVGLLDRLGLS